MAAESATCPYHVDHENRMERLEKEVQAMSEERISQKWWALAFSFVGVLLTGLCGLAGTLIGFYAKSQGWL